MSLDRLELGDLLARCAERWSARVVESCAAAGLPVGETTCRVLAPLFEEDGLPISEVGHRAGLAKSSMTTIVRGLVDDDLVSIEPDADDHRVKRLHLTAKGRDLEQVVGAGITRLRHRVTATLGPAGQRELHRTLGRLHDAL